jgi:hypothetical protein
VREGVAKIVSTSFLNRGVDGGGQFAARQAGQLAARCAPERLDAKVGPYPAVGSYRADRLHLPKPVAELGISRPKRTT